MEERRETHTHTETHTLHERERARREREKERNENINHYNTDRPLKGYVLFRIWYLLFLRTTSVYFHSLVKSMDHLYIVLFAFSRKQNTFE